MKALLEKIRISPNPDLDLPGFEASLLHCSIVGLALLAAASAGIFKFPVSLKKLILLASLFAAALLPLFNYLYNIKRKRYICDSLLILLAALFTACSGDLSGASILLLAYNLLKLFESFTTAKQRERAVSLMDILPDYALILNEGSAEKRKPSKVCPGDYIGVKQGDIIPADGVITEGISSIDYSPLTRSFKNEAVTKGMKVYSGGKNISEPIIIKADCSCNASFAQKIFASCSSAVEPETEESKIMSTAFSFLTPFMLALALLLGLIIPIFTKNFSVGLHNATLCLLIACSSAYLSSISAAVYSAVEKTVSSGSVIKSSSVFSKLSRLSTFICNKTSTLTESDFIIEDVCPEGVSIDNFLSVFTKIEAASKHPAAEAMNKYCGLEKPEPIAGLTTVELPGKGIVASLSGNSIIAGNAALLNEYAVSVPEARPQGIPVYMAINGSYCGYILFSNKLRSGAFDCFEKLRKLKVGSLVLLSSDLRSNASPIGKSLGFSTVRAELSPEEKLSFVEYVKSNSPERACTAYMGNSDLEKIPSEAADVSVCCDALGNESCLSFADVAILGSGISAFPEVLKAAKSCSLLGKSSLAALAAVKLALIIMLFIPASSVAAAALIQFLPALALLAAAALFFDKL